MVNFGEKLTIKGRGERGARGALKRQLTDLPFRLGQRVEAVMIAEDEEVEVLRALLQKTPALPAAKTGSEDMIAEEIAQGLAGR